MSHKSSRIESGKILKNAAYPGYHLKSLGYQIILN